MQVNTKVVQALAMFSGRTQPRHLSSNSDQSELFLKNCTNLGFYDSVKSWSRKEECAENEQVSPQVTLPLKWV